MSDPIEKKLVITTMNKNYVANVSIKTIKNVLSLSGKWFNISRIHQYPSDTERFSVTAYNKDNIFAGKAEIPDDFEYLFASFISTDVSSDAVRLVFGDFSNDETREAFKRLKRSEMIEFIDKEVKMAHAIGKRLFIDIDLLKRNLFDLLPSRCKIGDKYNPNDSIVKYLIKNGYDVLTEGLI